MLVVVVVVVMVAMVVMVGIMVGTMKQIHLSLKLMPVFYMKCTLISLQSILTVGKQWKIFIML